MSRVVMTSDLYATIVAAERAARHAHNRSVMVAAPFWTRWSLGRAQSILMHYVVKHADIGRAFVDTRASTATRGDQL